jgi:hypothetical protein
MRMSSSVAVHAHLHSRTVSYRSLTVELVRLSMGGTTPVSCSTSLVRRWMFVPTESSTLSMPLRRRTSSLRRGWRLLPTSSSSFYSCRGRHHPHPWTMRRSMPCLASMRTRPHHYLGCEESLFSGFRLG